ncbi:uncharacterized protein LOC116210099 [Punica granatum]|uniref:PB1 domain-containing protein n=2 Tax=Punica granatum TaxID=22663 RepID=A0A218WV49_PUNGR|nr:uncharacterized protein LOC116210099 [Punica granatum]OWM76111.1 hypothetical protein CDL15_Pgr009757 [Punica granatum]PKI77133.1 hypothetical protein CRG98_002636 [Punica granatum]
MEVRPSRSHRAVNADHILKTTSAKFLCSYGGKILPRYPDGKLRYHGGETRVLSVDRSISFADLLLKIQELCGVSVVLRCQLPLEDLDSLVSITTDEDLSNLIEEYDHASSPSTPAETSLKIRAFLSIPKPTKKATSSPSPSITSSSASSSSSSSSSPTLRSPMPVVGPRGPTVPTRCLHHQVLKLQMFARRKPDQWRVPLPYYYHSGGYYAGDNHGSHIYPIHHGNYWQ